MSSKWRVVSNQDVEKYEQQFRALHKDWHYFQKLIQAYVDSRADSERKRALEIAFLELKGRISCDYTVLAALRDGAYGIPTSISEILSEGTTLKSLAMSSRVDSEWQLVDEALGYIRQLLVECHEKTRKNKAPKLPAEMFVHGASEHTIDRYTSLCQALQVDWRNLHQLLESYLKPGANKQQLEAELLQLKSKIACEYPTLPTWFGGRDKTAVSLEKLLSGSSSLASLADGIRLGGRTLGDWKAVDDSIGDIRSRLTVARSNMEQGKPVDLPNGFVIQQVRRPFPIKKYFIRFAVLSTIFLVVGGAYFLRNFVGIGAPQPGEGMVVSASLADEEQAEAVLIVMNEAFVQGSVDSFMTTIANDFTDDEGNGRRALRIILQAYYTAGNFESARVIWSNTKFTRQDEWLYASPVIIRPNMEGEKDLYIRMGFKQHAGQWLISSAEGYN